MNIPPTWHPPKTAPRDGSVILADFGYPWPCLASWNAYESKWTATSFNAQQMENGKTDSWWETELEADSQLKSWTPVPKPVKASVVKEPRTRARHD